MGQQSNKFGTIKGVFTPSILTILGVIMYLRLPWIVGQAGLWATLGIVFVAHIISATTGLSVASIATDKKVETGGTYYMISRSLGLPIGGTLGLALFVGLSFSVSLYIIGFSETLLNAFGFEVTLNTVRVTGALTLLVVTVITFISTNLALRMQFVILAVMALSLASIFLGKHELVPTTPLSGSAINSLPWIALFAIFFPAVTGFEAGVSMSGDLANPKKAIPRGTILAITVGLIVYIGLVFFFAHTVERNSLINDSSVLLNISLYAPIVVAGVWGATLSSAFGSILGAPRILQATAIDRITPKVFAKGVGAGNEPRNAIILTFFIALAGILIGELNVIARVVSIFFIITYGFLNLTCAIENWAGADFRPSFRIPAWISIIGAIACFVVMIQLDFVAMIAATIILGAIFFYLKRKELKLQSGDTWGGFWSSLVKYGLLKLSNTKVNNQRNWRPNIILFSGNASARPHLIDMARILVGKQGVFTNFELIENSNDEQLFDRTANTSIGIDPSGKKVITRVQSCSDIYAGVKMIAQVYGFTGFEPNTILMGWGKKTRDPQKFYSTLQTLHRLDYNLVLLNQAQSAVKNDSKRIDLWWGGDSRNLNFGVALLKYITTEPKWRDANVRVLVINYNTAKTDSIYALVNQMLDNSRLLGSVKVINNATEKISEQDIIRAESSNAMLTILELNSTKQDNSFNWANDINQLTDLPCPSLFIEANSVFEPINAHTHSQSTTQINVADDAAITPFTQRLKFPEKELLAEETLKIALKHEELQNNFILNSIHHAESLFKEYHRETNSLISRVFNNLEKGLNEQDNSELKVLIPRLLSDYSFQTKSRIAQLQKKLLANANLAISDALSVFLSSMEQYNEALPEKITIKFSRSEFKIKRSDSLGIKLFKISCRIRGSLLGWPINNRVNLSKTAEVLLYSNRLESISRFFKQFGITTFNFLSSIRRTMVELSKIIEQQLAVPDSDQISITISNIKQQTSDSLSETIKSFQGSNRNSIQSLNTNLESSLQKLCSTINKPELNLLLATYKKIIQNRNLSTNDITNAPAVWIHNMSLFSNKILLEFILISLRHRFRIKLRKQVDELTRWANSKLTETISSFKSILEELKTASELPDTSNIFEKINGLKNPAMQDRFEVFFKDVNEIINDLPEIIEVNSDNFFGEIEKGNFTESEVREIDLRRKALFYVGTELISNTRNSMEILSDSLKEISVKLCDKLRLAIFNIENLVYSDDSINSINLREKLVDELVKDIANEENQIRTLFEQFENNLEQFLKQSMDPLNQLVYSKDLDIKKSIHKKQGKSYLSSAIGLKIKSATAFINKQLVRVLYSQSEGIMLAQKISNFEHEHKISNQAIQETLENLSGNKNVINSIPFYYISLFSGSTTLNRDLWIERHRNQKDAERIVSRFISGYSGALLITGNRNSGKTTFSKYIAKTYLNELPLHTVKAPKGGSADKQVFIDAFRKALNTDVDPYLFINSSPQQRVVVINDLELWWERHPQGLDVLKEIIHLIEAFNGKVFFIINCGTLAYKIMNKILNIDSFLMGNIECEPFDAKEIKELVMLRHRTGGLNLMLNYQFENSMSEWNFASLFNRYFNLSDGNPGYTLRSWLSNIKSIEGKTIHIKPPAIPNLSHLNGISDDLWLVVLQMSLHRRCTLDRLSRVLRQPEPQIKTLIREMQRAGLVEERFPDVFAINALLEPHLISKMEEKGFY